MRIAATTSACLFLLLSLSAGCRGKNPAAPTAAPAECFVGGVSLAISFVDDAGRGGSVTAIAPVSR